MQENRPGLDGCYAVIFTSVRTDGDNGYAKAATRMLELARSMPGFLGVESAREEVGVTVSYWESLDAIRAWRDHPEHLAAQARGRADWYRNFTTRVCKVLRESVFPEP
jgi:heme-degrading monooxygenase HmoA